VLRIVWSGLRAQVGRLLLTAAAIAGGAGFLAGTFVYADTARAAFYDEVARSARNVDVVVMPPKDEDLARISPETVALIGKTPGVSKVDARSMEILGMLDPRGRLISNEGHAGYAVPVPGDMELSRFDLVHGRLPSAPGEAAIDVLTADRHGFRLGGPVQFVTDDDARHPMTIVGLVDFGVRKGISDLSVAVLNPADYSKLVAPEGSTEVVVKAADPVATRDALAARMPAGYRVTTGDDWRHQLAVGAAKYVDGFQDVLFGFSLIALAVSVFVIYNTFTILTVRRSRELALWRCLGARRRQIRLLVLAEAALLGIAGGLAGVLVSLVIGWGLVTLRGRAGGTAVPGHALVLKPFPVALTLLVGTVTALIAALIPAWRAGHISPLSALQTAPLREVRPRGIHALVRVALSGLLVAAGAYLMKHGVPLGFDGLSWVFAGASVLFGGLILLAPLVVGPITALVGLPLRALGPTAWLALGQARHQPRRAAATASALMVGVGVLATVSVLLATAQAQSRKELSENFAVDFKLTSVDVKMGNGRATLPPAIVAELAAKPEFAAVSAVRTDLGIVDNSGEPIWSGKDLSGALVPEQMHGDLSKVGNGNIAIDRAYADDRGTELGSQLRVEDREFTVVAIYDDAPHAGVLLSWADYAQLRGVADADEIDASLAPGVSPAQGQAVLDDLLTRYPLIEVSGKAQARAQLTATFDRLLGIFTALLGVSLLIALVGIGNTLALSVWERTRESATLRAFGLSRAGLRAMLLLEAVLMALVGGGAGLVFGGGVGWVAALGLIRYYGHGTPVVPFGQFFVYLAVAALAAAVAALLPARLASRASITTGLAAE
jgi:putative ABC transport system permease protein